MPPARYPWIDFLKALGIFLVVVGHTSLPPELHRWIYAFHMPLFFMISGFLVSPGGFEGSLGGFFKRRVAKLVKLYLIFGLLGVAFYCYQFRHDQPLAQSLRDRLFSLVYASSSKNNASDLYPLVLWFFPALITGLMMTFAVWKIPAGWGRAVVALAVTAIGFLLVNRALPWELESGCIAAGCIALGHQARLSSWDNLLNIGIAKRWTVIFVGLLLGSFFAWLNRNSLDLRLAGIGNPVHALAAAGLLIIAWTAVAMMVPASRALTAVAAATILIFPLHTLLFPYADRLAMKLPLIRNGVASDALWYGVGKAALIVALLTLVHFCYSSAQSKLLRAKA